MTTPLLATKLYIPPLRPELVSRPRLIERLNEGLGAGRKLTLVAAPAGYGKTTLVSEWVHQVSGIGDRRLESGETSPSLVSNIRGLPGCRWMKVTTS